MSLVRQQAKSQEEGLKTFDAPDVLGDGQPVSVKEPKVSTAKGLGDDVSSSSESRAHVPVSIDQAEVMARLEALEKAFSLLQERLDQPAISLAGIEDPSYFDGFKGTRDHIGVRVMPKSKVRLQAIQRHLKMNSQGAALDYVLAFAESQLCNR